MYKCNDCEAVFEEAEKVASNHGLTAPPFEECFVCPVCGSSEFYEAVMCDRCKEWVAETEAKDVGTMVLCENCYDESFRQECYEPDKTQ